MGSEKVTPPSVDTTVQMRDSVQAAVCSALNGKSTNGTMIAPSWKTSMGSTLSPRSPPPSMNLTGPIQLRPSSSERNTPRLYSRPPYSTLMYRRPA